MRDQGVGSWIDRRARTDPDRPALISGGSTRTNAQLRQRIHRLANGLRGAGVQRGDRVAWLGANHPAFLETLFATAKLGAVLAPVNHRLDADGIAEILEHCEPRLIVAHAAVTHLVAPDSATTLVAVSLGDRISDAHGDSGSRRTLDFDVLVENSAPGPIDEDIGLDEICMLAHTSGTTGPPKGVMLTHGNVTWNALNMITSTDLRADDVTIAIAPFFRVGGTGVNVLPVLLKGGCVVVPDDTSPSDLLHAMSGHRVTVGFANPDLLAALVRAQHWAATDLSALRFVITGGAPVPERMLHEFSLKGVPCLQGYGMSEAGPVVMLLPPAHAADHLGSAGLPVTFCDVRLAHPDGSGCASGETGELLVRGPAVMPGYWRDRAATAAALDSDGWLHTGDAARADADGFFTIVDRVRDGFDTVGGRVYPGDIERVLLDHPEVADAAAAAMPGPAGLLTRVFVVVGHDRELTTGQVVAWCRERLPAHAVPASAVFVDRIPRSSVGKIVRARLSDLCRES